MMLVLVLLVLMVLVLDVFHSEWIHAKMVVVRTTAILNVEPKGHDQPQHLTP